MGNKENNLSIDDSPYRNLTVVRLKEELGKLGLSKSGRKDELIQRLEEANTSEIDLERNEGDVRRRTATSAGKLYASESNNSSKASISSQDAGVRKDLVLWRQPVMTIRYFLLDLQEMTWNALAYAASHRLLISVISIVFLVFLLGRTVDSEYRLVYTTLQFAVQSFEDLLGWYIYWIILGVASSIGLGTGLHTFLLFLGPLIAKVTVFAYNCGSTDFELHGPEAFTCPSDADPRNELTITAIYTKVMVESFAWGAGTAIGELPPYFVARAAALAGQDDEEIDHISAIKQKPKSQVTMWEHIQVFMFDMMQKLGFFGILLSASIPNPLFDLAGITCGHFLIPFGTFFGATFIGKALIKASIQTFSVIILFSKKNIEGILSYLKASHPSIHESASKFFKSQQKKFTSSSQNGPQSASLIAEIWNIIIFLMIAYFVVSIINSMATNRFKKDSTTATKKKTLKRGKNKKEIA